MIENQEKIQNMKNFDPNLDFVLDIADEPYQNEFANLKQSLNLNDWPKFADLSELQKNPVFSNNRARAKQLNEAWTRLNITLIYKGNLKLNDLEKTALIIATYYYYKLFPDSFSIEDMNSFLFFTDWVQNIQDKNNIPSSTISKIQNDFNKYMYDIEQRMLKDNTLKDISIPIFTSIAINSSDEIGF